LRLEALVSYLDDYLRVPAVPDYPEAMNGLQCANSGEVTRVAAAVDLCEATITAARNEGADFLLVHHGLFWGGLRPFTGAQYRRVASLLAGNVALYSSHLPLDRHPDVGNNPLLARALGFEPRGEWGESCGAPIGVWGEVDWWRDEVAKRIQGAVGAVPKAMLFGPERVRRVGVVTGAGGSLIAQAEAAGLDTYITGEGSHHTFFDAEERRLNVFYAGHYATETFGVKALGAALSTKFQLPWTFLDHPTGL
jgi:dinuclear metal center YbgI/SA1388 family protein